MKYSDFRKRTVENNGDADGAALYFVFGDDEYLKERVYSIFRARIDAGFDDFNIVNVDIENDISAFIDALYTFPVFSERKYVFAHAPEKLPEAYKKALSDYIATPNATSAGVLKFEKDADKAFTKNKAVIYVDCNKLEGAELENEINALCRAKPSREIEAAALHELIKRTSGDLTRISSEINKLKAYSADTIAFPDIVEMVAPDTDFQIFELSGAVSEKNTAKALEVLSAFIKSGVRPMTVLGLLYNQYRKMLFTELNKNSSDAEVAAMLGVKPAAVYYTRKVSKNYSQIKLKQSVDLLHEFQCDVVSGRRSEKNALDEAVIRLLNA